MYNTDKHTFVICAYEESPFLEECICSLMAQTVKSKVVLSTSTPNDMILNMADKYHIPVYVNTGAKGIAGDWNFACSISETSLVTIAHQDDIYEPWYLEQVLKGIKNEENTLIIFTDYGEIRDGKKIDKNNLLGIKRLMLFPLRASFLKNCIWIRRRVLSLGSPISCPTVTYVKNNLPDPLFLEGYRSDLDWQAWERFSRRKGAFVYCPKICMYHRIHEGSATTEIIADSGRSREDLEMFCKFWPVSIARIVAQLYRLSEKSNDIS